MIGRIPDPTVVTSPWFSVSLASPEQYPLGVEVAVAAKRATGIPHDVDEDQLRVALAARQHAAAGVWLALDADGTAIGHALVAVMPNDHYTWGPVTDPLVTAARRDGKLLELGGLSVHPDHQRRSVARTLQRARLGWARAHGYLPVAAAWDDSAGSTALCQAEGHRVGTHPDLAITLYRLDRAA